MQFCISTKDKETMATLSFGGNIARICGCVPRTRRLWPPCPRKLQEAMAFLSFGGEHSQIFQMCTQGLLVLENSRCAPRPPCPRKFWLFVLCPQKFWLWPPWIHFSAIFSQSCIRVPVGKLLITKDKETITSLSFVREHCQNLQMCAKDKLVSKIPEYYLSGIFVNKKARAGIRISKALSWINVKKLMLSRVFCICYKMSTAVSEWVTKILAPSCPWKILARCIWKLIQ